MVKEIFEELRDDYKWSMEHAPDGPVPDYEERLDQIKAKWKKKQNNPVPQKSDLPIA